MEEYVTINMHEYIYEIDRYPYNDPLTRLPIVNISWVDAVKICIKMTEDRKDGHLYRLPTEAEWEYAATRGDGRIYPWGDEFDSKKCNTIESGIGQITRVDNYPNGKSPFGCYNMAGNVWEWAYEGFNENILEVLRGGSWNNNHDRARCAYRHFDYPDNRYGDVGFRPVRIKIC